MDSPTEGSCHCGAVALALFPSRPLAQLPLRRCSCTFCTRQQPTYTSDPAGKVVITARRADALHRYRFGTKTADFLMCKHCGVYLGAVCEIGGQTLAVINIVNLGDAASFKSEPAVMSLDGEDQGDRERRRAASWTPAEVRTQPRGDLG